MKNKKISLWYSMVCLFAISILFSCKEDDIVVKAPPTVMYPTDELYVDLNEEQPPIICVVNSETGLQSVAMYIILKGTSGEEMQESLGTVTEFYSKNTCSIRQTPLFTEDMLRFKLVATDIAGQVTVSTLEFNIVRRSGLPVLYFSSDEEGELRITPPLDYVEDSYGSDIYLHVSGNGDDLKTITLSQSTALNTTEFKEITFAPGVKDTTINVMDIDGVRHVFPKGTGALRAKAVAGSLNKEREISLSINYIYLISFSLDTGSEQFNGLPVNASKSLSGNISHVNALLSFTYTLFDRKGNQLQAPTPVVRDSEGNFTIDFTATSTLGSIKLDAMDINGKTNSETVEVHVGYKFYHLLAGPAGGGTSDIYGPFFSAAKGEILAFCDAKVESMLVDGGFSVYAATDGGLGGTIRFSKLGITATEKFNPTFTSASACGVSTWASYVNRDIGLSSIKYKDFDKAGIDDFKDAAISGVDDKGIVLFRNLTSTAPMSSGNVAIYETQIGGVTKKVILCIEKAASHNPDAPLETTFYTKIKVAL